MKHVGLGNIASYVLVCDSVPRLETRTKESSICASSWVGKLTDIMQAKTGMLALATDLLTVKGLSYNICVRTRKMVNYA